MFKRIHLVFLVALLVTTYGAGQLWQLALDLRRGELAAVQLTLGAASLILLVLGLVVTMRILWLTSRRCKHDDK